MPIIIDDESGVTAPAGADPSVSSPAGLEEDLMDTLEEGETRDSTPEPGQIIDTDTRDKESPRLVIICLRTFFSEILK